MPLSVVLPLSLSLSLYIYLSHLGWTPNFQHVSMSMRDFIQHASPQPPQLASEDNAAEIQFLYFSSSFDTLPASVAAAFPLLSQLRIDQEVDI